jgi:hypothetical protein
MAARLPPLGWLTWSTGVKISFSGCGPEVSAIALAFEVLDSPTMVPATDRIAAAAILGRQAIEAAVASFWFRTGHPAMATVDSRVQFIALPVYLREPDGLATEARHAWLRLTRLCHTGTYELRPNESELRLLLQIVVQVEQLGAQ